MHLIEPLWRDDLGSVEFTVPGHGGRCVIHARAIATLMGAPAGREDCLAFARANAAALDAAARDRIARKALAPGSAFHLTSRDIRRALRQATP